MQEAGEHHAHDPVYLRGSVDGRHSIDGRHSMDAGRPVVVDDGPGYLAQPLLGRSISVTLQNPAVAKAQQEFQAAFQTELVKVSTFYRQEMQRLEREIDALSERTQSQTRRTTSLPPVRPILQLCSVKLHSVLHLLCTS